MNGPQLDSFLESMLLENPVVDPDESYQSDAEHLEQHITIEEWDDSDPVWPADTGRADERMQTEDLNLRQRIFLQVLPKARSQKEEAVLRCLIRSLDDNGYLLSSAEDIALQCSASISTVTRCLKYLQQAEPFGIGARSLQECLLIQLMHSEDPAKEIAIQLVQEHLPEIADNRSRQLARSLERSEEQVINGIRLIRTLNPKPLNGFSAEHTQYIHPDVLVEDTQDGLRVRLQGNSIHRLAIVSNYCNLYSDSGEDVRSYLQEYFEAAQWINHCLEQRQTTLTQVVSQIILEQQAFFHFGPSCLKPLKQGDLAEKMELSDSTISRAISDKYLKCRWGTFPLKYFFPKPSDADMSVPQIKAIIRELIAAEDPAHPLSDQKIADILSARGIGISRRTAAKYRMEMEVPDTSHRRNREK